MFQCSVLFTVGRIFGNCEVEYTSGARPSYGMLKNVIVEGRFIGLRVKGKALLAVMHALLFFKCISLT